VYIGTPDNDQFMGPQDPQKLAEHILKSEGPSGPNIDYLLSLEAALDGLSPESGDEHVKDLSNRIRELQKDVQNDTGQKNKAITCELQKVGSTDEQEETEKQGF
jgi:cation transport protein ChaC